MDWSRRELLSGLGVGAAATLLATLGCGGTSGATGRTATHEIAGPEVRTWLRAAVEALRVEFPAATAHAVVARRISAAIDLRGRGIVRGVRAAVVLRADDGRGHVVERGTSDLSAAGVSALVASLRRTTTPGRGVGLGAPEIDDRIAVDPNRLTDARWLELVGKLEALADPVATSRVVYRGAWLGSDDVTVWHVASGPGLAHDREQRLIRSRGGLVLMSWSGTSPMVGQLERGAVGGPEQVTITDADIRTIGRGALELTTPGTVPAGVAAVLLMPSVVARLADVALAPMLTTTAWMRADLPVAALAGQSIASTAVTVKADPSASRYGGYHFDDEGATGKAAALIERGVLRAPVADRLGATVVAGAVPGAGLRAGHTGVVRPAIGHLAWVPGTATADPEQLELGLDDAWVVDDAGAAHVDPATWAVTIEVGRARRLRHGARTGHVHTAVELSASVPDLLAAVTAVSSTTETFVAPDGGGSDARWRSLEVPAVVTRAMLQPRRPA